MLMLLNVNVKYVQAQAAVDCPVAESELGYFCNLST
jgi:hypothetical protein